MPRHRYVICDVFTDRALTGNALAVFTDARGLDGDTMQALARETNLSETTFLLPAEAGGDARIRIFTPTCEVPFAGHPVLGTAFAVAAPLQRPLVRLETGKGIVPVRFEIAGNRITFGWMEQPIPRVEAFPQRDALVAALGLGESDLAGLPIEQYDNGIQHVYVALRDPVRVGAIQPDGARIAAATRSCVNAFARLPDGGPGEASRWKTRMFAPWSGILEDPATGSAAGPLAVHVVRHGLVGSGQEIAIEQGAELRRPSRLAARATVTGETLDRVEVGGSVVLVARGEFAWGGG